MYSAKCNIEYLFFPKKENHLHFILRRGLINVPLYSMIAETDVSLMSVKETAWLLLPESRNIKKKNQ